MTKKSNRITNILGLLLVLAMTVMSAQPASAAVGTTVSVTDGGDNIPFYGETMEFTWNSTVFAESTTYISIVNLSSRGASNTTWSFPGLTGMNQSTFIVNDNSSTPGQYVNNIAVSNYAGGGTTSNPWLFRYYLRNDTIPNSGLTSTGGLIGVYVNTSTDLMDLSGPPGNPTTGRAANYTLYLNAWNLSFYTNGTNRAAGGTPSGTSTLKGDRLQVTLNTFGVVSRDGVAWTLTTPNDTGATISGPTLAAPNTGAFTWNITTNTPGVFKNITLSTGVSHYMLNRDSNFIATNITAFALGLTKDTTTNNGRYLQYNVSTLNITTYNLKANTNNQSFASVNITSTDLSGNRVLQIIPYSVNLTYSTDLPSAVSFNLGARNVLIANTIIHAGFGENYTDPTNGMYSYSAGNYTYPLIANVSTVSSLPATQTLTVQANTSLTNFTKGFTISDPNVKVSLTSPAAGLTFTVGDFITISGVNATPMGQIFVNISGPSGVIPANSQVWNMTAAVSTIDGSWNVTWLTNQTWNGTAMVGAGGGAQAISFAPTGTYTITAGVAPDQSNTTFQATRTLTIGEDFTPTQSRTTMGPDDTLFINTTSNRRIANGTVIVVNLTSGARVVNATRRGVVDVTTFNAVTNISTTNISWIPGHGVGTLSQNTGLESLGKMAAGTPITVSISVNDTAVSNTSMTVSIIDNLAITTTSGVAGRMISINGTSSRANGTPLWINLTGSNYANLTTASAPAFVWGGTWNQTWMTTVNGLAGGSALQAGAYTVNVNDTIVSVNGSITLSSAAFTVSAPSTANIDDIVTISGTTNLPPGTTIEFNVTTSGGMTINNSRGFNVPVLGLLNTTVTSGGSYSTVWRINESKLIGSASGVAGNFTGPSSTTYTITANETGSTVNIASTTIKIYSNLTANSSRPTVVPGDSFNISGTTNRKLGTRLNITVVGTNINQKTNTTVLANGDYQATIFARSDLTSLGTALSSGTYKVYVNDTLPASTADVPQVPEVEITNATTTFTVGSATIGITSPTSGQVIANNTNITISGTSNRGAATGAVTLTITQSSGGTYSNSTITADTISNGNWTTYWNTAGTHLNGAIVTAGGYTIIVTTSGQSAAVSVTLTAAVPVLSVSASPSTVTVNTATNVNFTVTSAGAAVNGAIVNLSGAGVSTSGTTGADGNATISVTATSAGTITATASKTGFTSGSTNITAQAAVAPALVSSITPTSRNAVVGTPVTIFMSVINYGTATATNVSITQAPPLEPVTVSYQQWNGTAFIGSPNTPANIAAGATANYVLTINATSAFTTSPLTFNVSSDNGATAPISAVNTLTIAATAPSATPLADVIMISTNLDNRTAVNASTFFAVATYNVGANATNVSFNIVVPSSITGLAYLVQQTNATTGLIIGPATGLTINTGDKPTFGVFLTKTQPIALDLVNNRITLQLKDGSGNIIGAQSVAISTT